MACGPSSAGRRCHVGAAAIDEGEEVVLPGSVTAGGGRYVEMRWVGWPLERESGLPLAKVVWKVAEAAEE